MTRVESVILMNLLDRITGFTRLTLVLVAPMLFWGCPKSDPPSKPRATVSSSTRPITPAPPVAFRPALSAPAKASIPAPPPQNETTGKQEIRNSRNGLRRNLEAFDVVEGYGQIAAWRAIIGRDSLIVS